jgi:serine/threonine-protein kinase
MNEKRPSDPGAADGARLEPIAMEQASAAVLTPKPLAAASIDATIPMSRATPAAAPGLPSSGVPRQIGRYQILDRVGQGGMGVLYRGVDPVLDREVAIKLMIGDFADDIEQLRPRFEREARAIARLQHRNIVTVFEFAEDAGTPYIVMEFLRGTSLSARLKAAPPLSIVEKLDIVAQLCDGLGYAHEQGIVHRDVKPANIFLLGDGSVKLLDFGIAKLTTSNLTRQGDVLGSPSYMSPEQIMGLETIDGRSDVFSAGVVLFELLAGRRPFDGDTTPTIVMKILNADPPSLDALDAAIPAPLASAVARALHKDPAKRFKTATDFARELQAVRRLVPADLTLAMKGPIGPQTLAGGGAIAAEPAATPASTVLRRKWSLAAGIGGGVIAAAILVAFGVGRSTSRTPEPGAVAAAPVQTARVAPGDAAAATVPPPGKELPAKEPAVKDASAVRASREATSKSAGVAERSTSAGRAATGAKAPPPAETSSRTAAAPSAAVQVAVRVEGAYPFAILDGSRVLSPAATSHQLTVAAGRRVRLVAAEYSLNQAVAIEENADRRVDLQAPALGKLTIRSSQETCTVKIGDRDLGYPPVNNVAIAGGSYQIDLVCPNGRNKSEFVNIVGGQSQRVILQ